MRIQTTSEIADLIEETASPEVSVSRQMTRSAEVQAIAILTLHFALNVDIPAIAKWLFEKLKSDGNAFITSESTNVKFKMGSIEFAIRKEVHREERQEDTSNKKRNRKQ